MIYETFQCSKSGGGLEYGFTFKAFEGDEDTLFDWVIATITPHGPNSAEPTRRKMLGDWRMYEWAAALICAASVAAVHRASNPSPYSDNYYVMRNKDLCVKMLDIIGGKFESKLRDLALKTSQTLDERQAEKARLFPLRDGDSVPTPKQVADLRQLCLDMGHIIRSLDPGGDHSEVWTNDGEYIPDYRFKPFEKPAQSEAERQAEKARLFPLRYGNPGKITPIEPVTVEQSKHLIEAAQAALGIDATRLKHPSVTVPIIAKWNTGRWYGEAGQRMAAMEVEGGYLFVDIDRDIEGYIPPLIVEQYGLRLEERNIMNVYDNQLCPYWARAYEFPEQMKLLREAARKVPAAERA